MSYSSAVDQSIQEIDSKLDEIEELLVGLPIGADQKRIIVQKIYELYSEIECAVEMSSVDNR